MHAAPSVRMTVPADPGWRAFISACAAAAAGSLVAWITSHAQPSGAALTVAALMSAAAAGGWAQWVWRPGRAACGVLAWDGAHWRWAPEHLPSGHAQSVAGEPRVMIDLGAWILLRFAVGMAARDVVWLPVSRRQAGASWPLWRAVLLARRPGPDPLTSGPP